MSEMFYCTCCSSERSKKSINDSQQICSSRSTSSEATKNGQFLLPHGLNNFRGAVIGPYTESQVRSSILEMCSNSPYRKVGHASVGVTASAKCLYERCASSIGCQWALSLIEQRVSSPGFPVLGSAWRTPCRTIHGRRGKLHLTLFS
jgi:hypothetical protein